MSRAIAVFGIGPITYPWRIQKEINKGESPQELAKIIAQYQEDIADKRLKLNDEKWLPKEGWLLPLEAKLNALSAAKLSQNEQVDIVFLLGYESRKDIEGLPDSRLIEPRLSEAGGMGEYASRRGIEADKIYYEVWSTNTTGNFVHLINFLRRPKNLEVEKLTLICGPCHKARVEALAELMGLKEIVPEVDIQTCTEIIDRLEPTESRLRSLARELRNPAYMIRKSTDTGLREETVEQRVRRELTGVEAIQGKKPEYLLPDLMALANDEDLYRILSRNLELFQPSLESAGIKIAQPEEIKEKLQQIREVFKDRPREYWRIEKETEEEKQKFNERVNEALRKLR